LLRRVRGSPASQAARQSINALIGRGSDDGCLGGMQVWGRRAPPGLLRRVRGSPAR